MASRTTIRDVAKEAGVSIASVSRVVSGARPVRPDVEQRVREAVERLHYRPSYVGRSLSTNTTGSIGLIVPDIGSAFFTTLIQACQRALQDVQLSLLLTDAQLSVSQERTGVRNLLDKQVDGLLISPCHHRSSRQVVEDALKVVPVVQIDRYASSQASRVLTDATATISMAIEHLHQSGYRTFAYVGATSAASTAYERERAFVRCVREYDESGSQRVLKGSFTAEWGREAARQLTERWPFVDAVVCANDLIAVGLLQGLRDLGRPVPEALGVTGCDDTFYAEVSYPSLTTISQPLNLMAETAVTMLRASEAPSAIKFPATLRARQSTRRGG